MRQTTCVDQVWYQNKPGTFPVVMGISASAPGSHYGSLGLGLGSEHHIANSSRDTGAGKGILRGAWATCGAGDLSIRIRVRARKKDSRVRAGVVHV